MGDKIFTYCFALNSIQQRENLNNKLCIAYPNFAYFNAEEYYVFIIKLDNGHVE